MGESVSITKDKSASYGSGSCDTGRADLVPGAGLEPALPFGKRILSPRFAQDRTIPNKLGLNRSSSYFA